MDIGIENAILLIIVSMIASAFFSGVEFAFISANRLKIALQKNKTGIIAKMLSRFYHERTQFLGMTLVGNNIALVLYGTTTAFLFEPYIAKYISNNSFVILLLQTLLSTIIILIFGEFLPKNLVRINPTWVLKLFAFPLYILYWLLYPIVSLIVVLSKWLLKTFFRINYEDGETVFRKEDLQHLIQESKEEGRTGAEKLTIFEKAIDLRNTKVRHCMVPRPEIDAVDVSDDIFLVKQKFIDCKHSKLVVYQDNIDNILGYFHHQDMLKNKYDMPRCWKMLEVPETAPSEQVLYTLIAERKSMAWVIDEYGGTAGIVTMEDIIEEIFGEIKDEHDEDSFEEIKISDNEYRFSARLEIDYINENYQLDLPTGEYETLAGFIVTQLENIPQIGEKHQIGLFECTVLEASNTRVETIHLKILNP